MRDEASEVDAFELISPVFRNGSSIPPQYTCKGHNVNPPLTFFNVPDGTQSLTLIMHDPDAVGGDFLHWLVWDIPPATEAISVNSVPVGALQGQNGSGTAAYTGPCPPKGTGLHHYVFELYALDTTLDLPAGSDMGDVAGAQKGHVLAKCELTGLFAAD
jgi:Raf kinase inhibitor-like YbhB/YbcL family protein